MDIILASKSLYRKKLLEEYQIPFEVVVSDADETPDIRMSYEEQLRDISMRKAKTVLEMTKERGARVIAAADMNIVFEGKMYGKPKSIEEARSLILLMRGSNQIFSYVGNAILYAEEERILRRFNNYSMARMRMENISLEEVEDYLKTSNPLSKCAGIVLSDAKFLHLEEGFYSTACGMTVEYLRNFIYIIENEGNS